MVGSYAGSPKSSLEVCGAGGFELLMTYMDDTKLHWVSCGRILPIAQCVGRRWITLPGRRHALLDVGRPFLVPMKLHGVWKNVVIMPPDRHSVLNGGGKVIDDDRRATALGRHYRRA